MVEVDISKEEREIPIKQFLSMNTGYENCKSCTEIHLDQKSKKGEYVTRIRFKDMLTRELAYRKAQLALGNYEPGTKQGKRPAYVWIIKPKPVPVPQSGIYQSPRFVHNLKQGTHYWCAPFMEEQLIYELYDIRIAQSEMARESGTGTAGTGHAGVINGITMEVKQLKHKVSCVFKNFSDTGWTKLGEMVTDPVIGIGIHCLYRNKWGHYMVPVYLNLNTKIVGFSDSLNTEDILYVPFSDAESWIKNNYGGQPSVFQVNKIS
jgi:hypothetical protein